MSAVFPELDPSNSDDTSNSEDPFTKQLDLGIQFAYPGNNDSSYVHDRSQSEARFVPLALRALRDSGQTLIYPEIACRVYPDIFNNHENIFYTDAYGQSWPILSMIKKEHINKIRRQVRSNDASINKKLDLLEGNVTAQIDYLQEVSVAIRIGFDEHGNSLLTYHGPDAPQSESVLEAYVRWAETHKSKNSRTLRLANQLHRSVMMPHSQQINLDDYPEDEDFDIKLNISS